MEIKEIKHGLHLVTGHVQMIGSGTVDLKSGGRTLESIVMDGSELRFEDARKFVVTARINDHLQPGRLALIVWHAPKNEYSRIIAVKNSNGLVVVDDDHKNVRWLSEKNIGPGWFGTVFVGLLTTGIGMPFWYYFVRWLHNKYHKLFWMDAIPMLKSADV